MSCGVVPSKVAHDQAGVHLVMEEASKECGLFLGVNFGWLGPIWVWLFDPSEVIIGKVGDHLMEMTQGWVSRVRLERSSIVRKDKVMTVKATVLNAASFMKEWLISGAPNGPCCSS